MKLIEKASIFFDCIKKIDTLGVRYSKGGKMHTRSRLGNEKKQATLWHGSYGLNWAKTGRLDPIDFFSTFFLSFV